MSDSTTEAREARRHIIKRPRLTRLLDETSARIILLVAPAGYGKTTLAREWCESLAAETVWYQAGPAARDVAALATELSRAVENVLPGSGERLRAHLQRHESGQIDLEKIVELLTEDLGPWPRDGLLVIDDYHHAIASTASENLVGLLAERAPIRILIVSRLRPSWASARRFIYGHLLELSQGELAMTESEVDQALPEAGRDDTLRLRTLAGGWPAVIGLAALTSRAAPPRGAIAETLHAYFAQELFDATAPVVKDGLIKLAVLPSITRTLAEAALGEEPTALLSEAARGGFLTPQGTGYDLHPLLREFLLAKTFLLAPAQLGQLMDRVIATLVSGRRWDDAFAVIEECQTPSALPTLLRASLEDLLREGRVETIRRWTECAHRFQLNDPLIDLAEAECALRASDHTQANFFAQRAARNMPSDDEARFRALALAGMSAHAADDYAAAGRYYKSAEAAARTPGQIRDSLWGQFTAAHHLELPESASLLEKLEALADDQVSDDLLRIADGRFRAACLAYSPLAAVRGELRKAYELIDLAANPHAICSFLLAYAQCLMLTGNYAEALAVSGEAQAAAHRYGLGFARPYAMAIEAFSLFGLKRFGDADKSIETLFQEAKALGDTHSLVNARVARARILAAQGSFRSAIETTDDRRIRAPTPAMRGESLAVHALVLASNGDAVSAEQALQRARAFSRGVETETTALAAEAVIGLQRGRGPDVLARLLQHVEQTQHVDALVAAYRAYPPLLAEWATQLDFVDLLDEILSLAADRDFAASMGIPSDDPAAGTSRSNQDQRLSPREHEVLALVARGLSNHAIAQRLYISEATVKVHLRHIFEKLGVRSRTQAAVHPVARRSRYATSDISAKVSPTSDSL